MRKSTIFGLGVFACGFASFMTGSEELLKPARVGDVLGSLMILFIVLTAASVCKEPK